MLIVRCSHSHCWQNKFFKKSSSFNENFAYHRCNANTERNKQRKMMNYSVVGGRSAGVEISRGTSSNNLVFFLWHSHLHRVRVRWSLIKITFLRHFQLMFMQRRWKTSCSARNKGDTNCSQPFALSSFPLHGCPFIFNNRGWKLGCWIKYFLRKFKSF